MVKIFAARPADNGNGNGGNGSSTFCTASKEAFFSIPVHVKSHAITLCQDGKVTDPTYTPADDMTGGSG